MTMLKKYYGRVYKHHGQWKISVQHNGTRKTFYSSTPDEKGRKECAQKVVDWITSGAVPANKSRLTVDDVYSAFLRDKALEQMTFTTFRIAIRTTSNQSSEQSNSKN